MLSKEYKECWLCKTHAYTDVHHVFNASLRSKSEKYGATIDLCRNCHDKVHKDADLRLHIKSVFQRKIMSQQSWSMDDWRRNFYKNYLEVTR